MPFFGKIGWLEAVVILAIVLIIFGPGKLPDLSRSAGQAIKNFKRAVSGKDQGENLDAGKDKNA